MKKGIIFVLSIFLLIITGCSKDGTSPNDQFDTFINQWNKQEFTEMYEILTNEATEQYDTDDFIDRYEKTYKDLHVSDLKVTYDELSDNELKTAQEKGKATIPFHVEMDTFAGEITYDYEATLIRSDDDDEDEGWYVNWDKGFIFPELADGGTLNVKTENPKRGEILDRNKMPLAMNDIVYEIGIIPEDLGDNKDAVIERAGQLLNLSVDEIENKLNEEWVESDLFVPLKKVPQTNEEVLNELWELDSIVSQEVTGRIYPSGKSTAHLIGYVGTITDEELKEKDAGTYSSNDEIGKRGLEQLYEKQLRGVKGRQIVVENEGEEDVVLAETPVEDGENVQLTIDVNVQDKIYDAFDGEAGTAASINPKTGETLALVSSPAFDPNDIVYKTSKNLVENLQDDPKIPLLNRFSSTYAPGSVMKPITAAIGLENGTINADEGIEINGLTWSNGEGWGDYKVRRVSTSDKPVDLADALRRSDNIYFAMQAVDMGVEKFSDGLKQYGFEEEFPFTYPFHDSTISSTGEIDSEVALANTAYGQAEIEMTSLHLALIYSSFLNEGDMVKPALLTTDEKEEIWHEEVISPEYAKDMQTYLREVVTEGTASKAKRDDLAISGKTGTAELKLSNDKKGHENGWFVGYPTDSQDIIVAMMIEHSEDIGTSSLAAEKVADVLEKVK